MSNKAGYRNNITLHSEDNELRIQVTNMSQDLYCVQIEDPALQFEIWLHGKDLMKLAIESRDALR